MTLSPLVRAVAQKRIVLDIAPDNLKSSLAQFEQKARDLERSKKDKRFFGFEGVKTQADEMTLELDKKSMHIRAALAGFPEQLDYSFLSWRRKSDRWPVFFILDEKSNEFEIYAESGNTENDTEWSRNIHPHLPESIAIQYSATIRKLIQRYLNTRNLDSASIATENVGPMPDGARAQLVQAQKSRLFDRIFVIGEAKNWKYEEVVRVNDDPIVVGWVENTEQMFIITMYNPTPFEKYVAEQYAWKTSV